ncbi:MAG: DUF1800 family protein [Phycisphaerales bacterium]
MPSNTPTPPPPASAPPPNNARAPKPAKAPLGQPQVPNSLAPLPAKEFGLAHARHLLWRAGFGGSPEQIKLLADWGPEKSVEYLVQFDRAPGGIDEGSPEPFDKDIMRPATQEERQMQRRAASARDEETLAMIRTRRQEAERKDREQIQSIRRWWLKRMIETGRPLEEKLTLFWHGLLATSYRTIEDSYHMYRQNQLFRKHAAGNYGELLRALIRDPAMLAYLDQNDSRKNKPNENLARELMELFSLGVGNYTEQDIKEGARALTGFTFVDDEFRFQTSNHDTGVKNILGRRGPLDGDGFVEAILDTPECSRYMARRLYRYFVADYPTGRAPIDRAAEGVMHEMASDLSRNRYELRPVLRKVFLSRHFYDRRIMCEQIKSPVELVVGAIRSLNLPARDLQTLLEAMNMMGQAIMFPPSVKGWEGGRSWINTSTMFVRQNTLVYMLTGKRPQGRDALADEEKFDAGVLESRLAAIDPRVKSASPDERLDAVLEFAVGRTDLAGRSAAREFLASRGEMNAGTLADLLLLVTAMPEYQLC